ncbi:amidase [Bradyrhizobium sp.]|uniref:amidase n=1 Tax=Bradyrhizobium sp. TaxID=376 RepID=UPI0039E29AB4
MHDTQLVDLSATAVVTLLRARKVSPLEVVDAAIERIEAVDGQVNALPVRMFEKAREAAKQFKATEAAAEPGWLAGLPIAIKEFNDIAGERTTYGSRLLKDVVATSNDLTVRNFLTSGAILIAKSNVPEIAGANTFNPVYGATKNPWNLKMSAGGSSGGSAAALASREVWLANGSDLGGSLRIPASYCGVVGLRPSVGRVPRPAADLPFDPLTVEGPMARSVADLALMLDAQSRDGHRDALALPRPKTPFVDAIARPRTPTRVAYSKDLGLSRNVDHEVVEITRAAALAFESAGSIVDDVVPDFAGSIDCFQTLRALLLASMRRDLLSGNRELIAPEIVWNIEKGLALTADQIVDAEQARARVFASVAEFFDHHDVLACPTVALPPFPVEQRYPTSINGEELSTYIDWMFLTFCLTVTGCPVISIPCGLTKSGLPVGIQLMGRPGGDFELLSIASKLEEILNLNIGLGVANPATK